MRPPTASKSYLDETEPAVRHLFEGLAEYDALRPPSILQYQAPNGVIRMTEEENAAFLKAHERSFALDFARATLAGSVLQVAYMGLRLNNPVGRSNPEYKRFNVPPHLTYLLAGREVGGIPIALLIYAGRIQYNHWDEGEPTNKVPHAVFDALREAHDNDPTTDFVYYLDDEPFSPGARPLSMEILRGELGWRNYDDYLMDMQATLP